MAHKLRTRLVLVSALGVSALALSACGATETDSTASQTGPDVVASTTIWGDITSQIVECAGSGQVTTLIPVGADPHDYSPSSTAVADMVNADLVVVNGLGLEEGLEGALESAELDGANVYTVAPNLDPMPFEEGEGHSDEEGEVHSEEEEGHSHEGEDPHVWLDMNRAATGAGLIGEQLAAATGDEKFATCGQETAANIEAANAEVVELLNSVPSERRVLVTDHDAFGYFAAAYGYDVAGVVIPGGSTLGDASSTDLANLAAVISETGVPAIFANTTNPTTLSEALAAEVGQVQVVPLYVGSLGEPGSAAGTYQGMMLANAKSISDALNN